MPAMPAMPGRSIRLLQALPIEYLMPQSVAPRNAAHDADKLTAMIDAMRRRGWLGRPLLAVDAGGRVQALTGSHRIAAARRASLPVIPVIVARPPGAAGGAEGVRSAWEVIVTSAGWDRERDVPVDGRAIAGALRAHGMERLAALMVEG